MKTNHQDIHTPKILLKDYYKTPHWRNFRTAITDDKACKCEICGKPRWQKYKNQDKWKKPMRIEVHHLHYRHLFHENRDDVLSLCSSCHEFCHKAEMMSRTRNSTYTLIYDIILKTTPWRYQGYAR